MSGAVLDEIKRCLAQEMSSLGILLETYGDLTLKEMSGIALRGQKPLSKPLKGAILKAASRLYSPDTVRGLGEQLNEKPIFNTADHFGFSKGFFLQSDLMTAAMEKSRGHRYAIVLACSNISFREASLPSTVVWQGESARLSAANKSNCTLYTAPPFTRAHWLSTPEAFRELVPYDTLPATSFMDQISHTNAGLWEKAFGQDPDFPELIYLSMEEIVAELLVESIKTRDAIFQFCLAPETFRRMLDTFQGLPYCWDEPDRGTHVFWYNVRGKRKYPLRFDGRSALTYKDFSLRLDPDDMVEKLRDKTIIPGSFLSFLTLLHYNARVLGGPLQIFAIPEIWSRWCGLTGQARHDTVTNESQMSMYTLLFNGNFEPLNFDDIIGLPGEKRSVLFDRMTRVYERLTPGDLLSLFAFPAIITRKKEPHPFSHLLEYGDPRVVAGLLDLDRRLTIEI